jgi:hypothetical protein
MDLGSTCYRATVSIQPTLLVRLRGPEALFLNAPLLIQGHLPRFLPLSKGSEADALS